jgi:hypothetical protein
MAAMTVAALVVVACGSAGGVGEEPRGHPDRVWLPDNRERPASPAITRVRGDPSSAENGSPISLSAIPLSRSVTPCCKLEITRGATVVEAAAHAGGWPLVRQQQERKSLMFANNGQDNDYYAVIETDDAFIGLDFDEQNRMILVDLRIPPWKPGKTGEDGDTATVVLHGEEILALTHLLDMLSGFINGPDGRAPDGIIANMAARAELTAMRKVCSRIGGHLHWNSTDGWMPEMKPDLLAQAAGGAS